MKKATRSILKNVRRLSREKKFRDNTNSFIAEGTKIISDIFTKGHVAEQVIISNVFLSEPSNSKLIDELTSRGIPLFVTAGKDLDNISSLTNSPGIIAVLKKDILRTELRHNELSSFIILCDGIQDPGNIGSIIRLAAAFNAGGILLHGGCADICNPKVVRASSGMLIDVPMSLCTIDDLSAMKSDGFSFLISSIRKEGCLPVTDISCDTEKSILAFGSEGHGVTPDIFDMADEYFHIPISNKAESLNVMSAVAITLYEITRGK